MPRRRRPAPESPRKSPRQARAQETVDAILQAAAQLIAVRGWAATTTNRIAERAGVSIGSVYQYFPNKTAILVCLLERHVAEVWPVVERFLVELRDPARPIADTLRQLFVRLVEAHSSNPRLNRVLEEEVPRPRRIEKRHRSREIALAEEVAGILRGRPDVHVDHPLETAYALEQAADGLTRWLVHSAPESLDREAYIDASVRLLMAGLEPTGTGSSATRRRS